MTQYFEAETDEMTTYQAISKFVQSRYPRAYARGTWELKPEIQLQFAGVDLFLKLNISFDNVFVDPDCGGEKTNRPKLIPPIYLFDPGKALTDLPTRVGFYLSNDGRD